jgi:hypothetical protein
MSEPTPRKWYQKKRYILPLGLFGLFIAIGSIAPDTTTTQAPVQNVQSKQQQGSEVKSETVALPAQLTPLQVQQTPSGQQENITPAAPPVEQQAKTVEAAKPTPSPVQQQQATPPPPTYYTNVDGNKVQSPTKYDGVPAGASARCGDGTYSFSQNRRGTCSHHGGVAEWL